MQHDEIPDKQARLTHRFVLSPTLKTKVVAAFNNQCAICGADGSTVPLEFAFLKSPSGNGSISEDDIVLLCPNCHYSFDSTPREIEFVNFLADLLRESPNFESVRPEAVIGDDLRFRADLLANRKTTAGSERLLIECKRSPATIGRLQNVIAQIKTFQESYGPSTAVLAIPATLSEQHKQMLIDQGIEVWDLDFIAITFKLQIARATGGYYKLLFQTHSARNLTTNIEQIFIAELKATQPGLKDWSLFQSLIGDILEHLFCPTLVKPLCEHSDATKTNRRGFIMPNYAESGFWAFLRARYSADYVVVDAKNYTGKISKSQVLQMANYLKSHGAGLFGIIISRKGGDSGGCAVTLREQWAVHQKLILVLSDDDIQAMLLAKSDGRTPEEVIGSKIEEFRLSL